jgi:hypothetical protein
MLHKIFSNKLLLDAVLILPRTPLLRPALPKVRFEGVDQVDVVDD